MHCPLAATPLPRLRDSIPQRCPNLPKRPALNSEVPAVATVVAAVVAVPTNAVVTVALPTPMAAALLADTPQR